MKKKKRDWMLTLIGFGLIVFAIVPTPDDATVVSPVIAFVAGLGMVGYNQTRRLLG